GDWTFQSSTWGGGPRLLRGKVGWEGIDAAQPAPGVLGALATADLVVLAESSPAASLLPILGLAGVREALRATTAVRVALSPVVAAVPPAHPVDLHHWRSRGHPLRALGLGHGPPSGAALYPGPVRGFLIDGRDSCFGAAIGELGMEWCGTDLLDRSPDGRERLVEVLEQLAGHGVRPEAAARK